MLNNIKKSVPYNGTRSIHNIIGDLILSDWCQLKYNRIENDRDVKTNNWHQVWEFNSAVFDYQKIWVIN